MAFQTNKVAYDCYPAGEFPTHLEFPIGATSATIEQYDAAVTAFVEALNAERPGAVEYVLRTAEGIDLPESPFWEPA